MIIQIKFSFLLNSVCKTSCLLVQFFFSIMSGGTIQLCTLDCHNQSFVLLHYLGILPGGVVGNMLASHTVNPGSILGRGDT